MTQISDVIVIGAGMAGLAAAEALTGAQLHVKILEARDRIGGRAWTQAPADPSLPAVELGPEFIHGKPEEIWRRIRSARLEVERIPDLHHESTRSGLEPLTDFWGQLSSVFDHLSQVPDPDRSFQSFLNQNERLRSPLFSLQAAELAKSFVEGFYAADAGLISEAFLAISEKAAADTEMQQVARLKQGYTSLAEEILRKVQAQGGELHLQREVQRIQWSPEGVTVFSKNLLGSEIQIHQARQVLITLPIGVLKASPELLDPPVSELQRVLQKTEMGSVIRVVFDFRKKFWDQLGFIHSPEETFPIWWSALPGNDPRLTAWVGGPQAQRLSRFEDSEVLTQALESLMRTFNVAREDLDSMLLSSHFHSWDRDPYSRGAYSYVRTGGLQAQRELSEPIGGTLYFAGEALHCGGQTGTVDAALASGEASAEKILRGRGFQRRFNAA